VLKVLYDFDSTDDVEMSVRQNDIVLIKGVFSFSLLIPRYLL